uniref:RNA-directed RNA polymerase n=1 Tax=Sendai virus (strain Enders) TaxID=11194 RepID=Q84206_SENDE|nr:unknown protein [Human respirovirus 1]
MGRSPPKTLLTYSIQNATLNSPIVRGKIAQLHVLLDVNQPYRLKDDSIINITKHKIRNGGLSPRQIKIRSLGKALQRTIKDLDRYTFEPYPTYSQELLRLDIPEICDKIRSVFASRIADQGVI